MDLRAGRAIPFVPCAKPRQPSPMHVVHDSWDALILKERAIVIRAIGGVFLLAGIVMITAGVLGLGVVSVGMLIGGTLTAALGAPFALLPATHTFAFSRAERRLVVVRQRLGRTTREEYPLRDVVDAIVDTSNSGEDGPTFRVVVQLADGRSIPVTSYYSSGYESKRQAAERIQRFLGQAGSLAPHASDAPLWAATPSLTISQKRSAAAFIGLFGLVFGGIGGGIMFREHQRLTTWLPVEATVLSKDVDVNSDSDGTTYRPVVAYRYYVNHRPYTSNRVHPINEGRSGGWAHRIVAQYELNATYTAWYNPADPTEAFLRRSRNIVAPIFASIGALLLVASAFTVRAAWRRSPR